MNIKDSATLMEVGRTIFKNMKHFWYLAWQVFGSIAWIWPTLLKIKFSSIIYIQTKLPKLLF